MYFSAEILGSKPNECINPRMAPNVMGSDSTQLSDFLSDHYLSAEPNLFQTLINKSKHLIVNSVSKIKININNVDFDEKSNDIQESYEESSSNSKNRSDGDNSDRHELLKITEVPSYLRFNPWVLNGYRSPKLSTVGCLQSLCYFHNETINVLTHAVPLLYFLVFFNRMIQWDKITYTFLPFFHFFGLISWALGSASYHLFMNHKSGEEVYYRLLQFDMIGIWVTQSIGASVTIYSSVVTFPEWFQWAFIVLYAVLSVLALREGVLADSAWKRPASFSFLFLMRMAALVLRHHTASVRVNANMQMFHVIMQEIWPLVGALISATRVPERFWPGIFDYILNSHNIMHCFVVFGAIHMHWATHNDLIWLSSNNFNPIN